jgi:hypothetical protein
MSSLLLILLCCVGALIIHLWFYSDFFAYYVKSFKFLIPKKFYEWLLIEDYFNNNDPDLNVESYIEYLYIKQSFSKSFIVLFFLKLFSCVLCLTTWISLLISLIYGNILYIGIVFVSLRILDFILRFVLKKQI